MFPRMFTGIAAFMVFMAIACFTLKHPKTPLYSSYRKVQKAWGLAFLQWAIHLVIIVVFNLRETNFYASNILHLNSYFVALSFIGTSASVLLSPHSKEKNTNFVRLHIRSTIIFCILSLSTIPIAKSRTMQLVSLSILSLLFAIELLYLFITFFKNYRLTIRELDNYYAENAKSVIEWLKNTLIIATIFTVIAPLSLHMPEWCLSGYSLLAIPWVFYLVISFVNYRSYLDLLENATPILRTEEVEQATTKQIQSSNEKREKIVKLIEVWVSRHGFTENNLSIIDFSKRLGTNRTYMTQLINSEYGKTYREWITSLRVEYALQLLTNETSLTISEVSAKVGYSSPSYFSKVFTENVGLPPSKWQEEVLYEPSTEQSAEMTEAID